MTTRLKQAVSAGWLCEQLHLSLIGPDRAIRSLCPLETLTEDALSFALPGRRVDPARGGTIFGLDELAGITASVIASKAPRLDFIRAQYLLAGYPGFARSAGTAQVHPTVQVAPGAIIEPGVTIGEGTVIGPNAVLCSGVHIGCFCEIKSGAVLGDSGFGFERDAENRPLRMMHLGGVRIGDHVEIGALVTIVQGVLGDTVLEDHVKINDHVHVAHNCRIGWGTIVGGAAYLSGSLKVGRNCWIAPNCSIRQKLVIGDEAIIGIGAVVVHDVEPGAMVYGNPARKAARDAAPTGVTLPAAVPPEQRAA